MGGRIGPSSHPSPPVISRSNHHSSVGRPVRVPNVPGGATLPRGRRPGRTGASIASRKIGPIAGDKISVMNSCVYAHVYVCMYICPPTSVTRGRLCSVARPGAHDPKTHLKLTAPSADCHSDTLPTTLASKHTRTHTYRHCPGLAGISVKSHRQHNTSMTSPLHSHGVRAVPVSSLPGRRLGLAGLSCVTSCGAADAATAAVELARR